MPERAEQFLNVRETAARLRVTAWSIYQMVAAGRLPVHRVGPKGRTLRIAEGDLRNYLRRGRSAPSDDRPAA